MLDKRVVNLISEREVFLQQAGQLRRCENLVEAPSDEDGLDCCSFGHPDPQLVLDDGDRLPLSAVSFDELVIFDNGAALPLTAVLA